MKTSTTDVSCAERSGGKRLAARRDASRGRPEVFEEKGYAEATLDDVIARSGGRAGRSTLFWWQAGAFRSDHQRECETIFRGLTPEQLASRAPHEVLREVGVRYLAIVTSAAC